MKAEETITALTRTLASTATVRLAGLHKMAVFYTPLEERFERITRLGRRALAVPVAAVSLVSLEKQWFKSVNGWRVSELPMHESLCRVVVETGQPVIVPDTQEDPRYATSKLVTAAPNFRFYAGYPIRDAEGSVVGTFCVFDTKPRKVDKGVARTLADLGLLAERELLTADLWDAQTQLVVKLGEARRAALLDTLTRVWNRRGGTELLEMMMDRTRGDREPFALCLVDIDCFKDINDTHGHVVGDQVLRMTAATIIASVRPDDIVSRYGGDEFMLILRGAGAELAKDIAKRIRSNIQTDPLALRGGSINVTLSIGIAINVPAERLTSQEIIEHADRALYKIKQNGRDGVAVWND